MKVQTVLCPVDFSGQTGREISLAKQVCGQFGARLVLEHNLDPRPPNFLTVSWMWSEEFEGKEERKSGHAQRQLKGLLDELSSSVRCEAKLTRGPIDEVLLLLVKELPADLLVMGSHGWSSAEHQSLTEKMIARCSAPVLTVGNAEDEPPTLFAVDGTASGASILVSVDDDRQLQPALRFALSMAEICGGELIVMEVFPPKLAAKRQGAEERLQALVGESLGDRVRFSVREGDQVDAILAEAAAAEVDVIVRPVHAGRMPWQAKDRQADFDLLHRSPCPVAFVPAKYAA